MQQAFSFQVGVPLQHRQRLVATDHTNLNRVKALLKKPSDGLMAQVVKSQLT